MKKLAITIDRATNEDAAALSFRQDDNLQVLTGDAASCVIAMFDALQVNTNLINKVAETIWNNEKETGNTRQWADVEIQVKLRYIKNFSPYIIEYLKQALASVE